MNFYASLFFSLLFMNTIFAYPNFVYFDGNGNKYEVDQTQLLYTPISQQESSSGFYSGGASSKVKLSIKQKQELEKLFGLVEKSLQEEKTQLRTKGTGVLRYMQNENEIEIIYKMKSKTKEKIEKVLKSIKN